MLMKVDTLLYLVFELDKVVLGLIALLGMISPDQSWYGKFDFSDMPVGHMRIWPELILIHLKLCLR